jgi:hypothetical protein
MEEELDRATQPIPHQVFKQLMKLTLMHRWLEKESQALTDLWNLCDIQSEQDLLFDLLSRFKYLDSSHLKEFGEEIATHIVTNWSLGPDDTKIVAVSDKKNADGSLMFIQSLKNKFDSFGWTEENFIKDIGEGARIAKKDSIVILADDFIGTGKTIQRRYDWYLNKLNERKVTGVNIKVVALAALNTSKVILNNLGIDYFIPLWLNKGISDHYKGNSLHKAVNDMLYLESLLEENFMGLKLPSFGFEKSEALFNIESFNIPNNVFPIFWWPVLKGSKRRNTLFKRIR